MPVIAADGSEMPLRASSSLPLTSPRRPRRRAAAFSAAVADRISLPIAPMPRWLAIIRPSSCRYRAYGDVFEDFDGVVDAFIVLSPAVYRHIDSVETERLSEGFRRQNDILSLLRAAYREMIFHGVN